MGILSKLMHKVVHVATGIKTDPPPPPGPPEDDNSLPLEPRISDKGMAMQWEPTQEEPTKPSIPAPPLRGSLQWRIEQAKAKKAK